MGQKTEKNDNILLLASKASEDFFFFGKVLQSKSLRGIKKTELKTKPQKTMIIFDSERVKRARKIFGKVLQSKRLRGIKNRAKINNNKNLNKKKI